MNSNRGCTPLQACKGLDHRFVLASPTLRVVARGRPKGWTTGLNWDFRLREACRLQSARLCVCAWPIAVIPNKDAKFFGEDQLEPHLHNSFPQGRPGRPTLQASVSLALLI